mgnify:CR=1 FL=1|jgi:hypothetical protein
MSQPLSPASFDGLQVPWSWCGHCQRAYHTGANRTIAFRPDALHPHPATLKLCPYGDCGAGIARYQWPWANLRLRHSDYPTTPMHDTIYTY